MSHLVRYAFIVLLTLAALVILWEFREAIVFFLFSLVIGAVFRPMVENLVKRGIPRVPAIFLSYFTVIGFIILVIYLVSAPVGRELQHATDNFAVAYTRIQRDWVEGNPIQQAVAVQMPPIDDFYRGIAGDSGVGLFQAIVGIASNLFEIGSAIVIITALSMYWSADRVYFERLWLSLLPAGQRVRARSVWREIEYRVGQYVRSKAIQAIIGGFCLYIAYTAIGLRYPTILAILGAFAWLIPWIGAVLAIAPAFLLGLESGLGISFLAAGLTLVVLLGLELVIDKYLFRRRRYSSVLLVVIVIAMADVFGLAGVLIAPPLAAAIQIAGNHLLMQPSSSEYTDPKIRLNNLRVRFEQLKQASGDTGQLAPNIASYFERLDHLIVEADRNL
jgi:putative permease